MDAKYAKAPRPSGIGHYVGMPWHTFTGILWEHAPDQPGSWHFITVPADLADDLVVEAGPRRGFGSIRVEVRIGSSTWHTSLFPDSKQRSLVMPVKKQVRLAQNLQAGDSPAVQLRIAG